LSWHDRSAWAKPPADFNRQGGVAMRLLHASLSVVSVMAIVLVAMFAPTATLAQTAGKPMTTASGLQIVDSKVGTGASPKPGQICVMHYTGWLYENGQKGKKFDSSVDLN
jgi:hypothetical protein